MARFAPNVRLADGDFLLDHLPPRFTLIVRDDADELASLPTVRLPHDTAERFGLASKTAALLVRPDQHVCARWLHVTPQRVQAALARATTMESVAC